MNHIPDIYINNINNLLELDILDNYLQINFIIDDIIYNTYSNLFNTIIDSYKWNLYLVSNLDLSKSHLFNTINSCLIYIGSKPYHSLFQQVDILVDFIYIPTTLLSMLQLIPYPKTKYRIIISQFIIDLPRIELINGFAEIIKIIAMSNLSLWNVLVKNNIDSIIKQPNLVLQIIKQVIQYKNQILCLPNHPFIDSIPFGVTVASIIKQHLHIDEGFALALGMIMELNIQDNDKYLVSIEIRHQLLECIRNYELPITLETQIPLQHIETYLLDKDISIILLSDIGNYYTIKPNKSQMKQLFNHQPLVIHKSININHSQSIPFIGPGSKSETNRVLILSALGQGRCTIRNPLLSDDTLYMIQALKDLNFNVKIDSDNNIQVNGSIGKLNPNGETLIFIGNSGTSMRFLTCLLYLLPQHKVVIYGDSRMKQRPMKHLLECLSNSGVLIDTDNPITISGNTHKTNHFILDCSLSSQYLTGLMLIGSCVEGGITIEIKNQLVSKPFIEMTIKTMVKFGIIVDWNKTSKPVTIYIHQKLYTNPNYYDIEADATACSYPIAYAVLNKIPLYIPNLTSNNSQGDLFYSTQIISKFGGARIDCQTNGTTIIPLNTNLSGINTIDMNSSDTFLTIAILASLSTSGTVTKLINISNQNIKESNRIEVIYQHLSQLGVDIHLENEELTIYGSIEKLHKKLVVDSHQDHRIAMSLSLLAPFVDTLIIQDYLCVNKTYPDYWFHMRQLGLIPQF